MGEEGCGDSEQASLLLQACGTKAFSFDGNA
jgi:hypothetical protein